MLLVLAFLGVSMAVFAQAQSETPYIAVVSKGEQHDFWQQLSWVST
jgi:ABC-type sugar transport system substrate-binding protein